jgi:hypothetical protein
MIGSAWLPWTGAVNQTQYLTNLMTNPSAETSLANMTGQVATLTQNSSWASSGIYSVMVTPTAGGPDSYLCVGGDLGGMRLGMVGGGTYTVSGTINLTAAQTGTLDPYGRARTIQFYYRVGTNAYVSVGSAQAPNAAGTTRLSVTATLPAGVTEAFIRFYNGAQTGGSAVSWDGLMLTDGSALYNFGDGNSPGWAWSGAISLSVSSGTQ